MTVAGLKEANLQHCNEIRHSVFVSDTEQCLKKKSMAYVFVGPQVLYWIWKLEWFCQGGVAMLSEGLWKVIGNRQVCKMDTEPLSQEPLLQQRNYKDNFLSVPYSPTF